MFSFIHKQRYLVSILLIAAACDSANEQPQLPVLSDEEIIHIPVVVHVLYDLEEFNISDAKINSQIEALNKDFRKKNPDHLNTPQEFSHLVADVGIEFELASRDPQGNPTTGITRTKTTVSGWDGIDDGSKQPIEALPLYFSNQGGHDAWPADRYLNIWVAELSDRHGAVGLAGHANLPGCDPRIDGVIIDPRTLGTLPPLRNTNQLGRTATHEIGHWLSLIHIFADATCDPSSSDLVDDTPSSGTRYYGTPAYPQYSCGHSSMFMNFMDYVDDSAMYMFTYGQRAKMRALFAPGGVREKLYYSAKAK